MGFFEDAERKPSGNMRVRPHWVRFDGRWYAWPQRGDHRPEPVSEHELEEARAAYIPHRKS
jgi:hypothetical protein